ncbi:MAG TPA: helix-turn-helix domain-containing protein [Pyrinomonadaceae bacterium]|nr:helix-turn-helix domain-containing protein [Pyrinomonadaceae bacterium]
MSTQLPAVGHLLRDWRRRRRLSQLDLACEAEISSRHLSFVETGRSQPSREMVMRLSRHLDIPLRERNALLVAAGYAPIFKERSLDDPKLASARRVVDLILTGHEPYPALAVDRHWTMLAANRTVAVLLAGVETSLLQPPVNVLRLTLHPGGLADRIANLPEWRSNLLARLRRQVEVSADPVLASLLDELASYGAPEESGAEATDFGSVVVPFQLTTDLGVLSFLSTTTVFGTPVDITVSELALESFFPADSFTIDTLNRILQSVNSR